VQELPVRKTRYPHGANGRSVTLRLQGSKEANSRVPSAALAVRVWSNASYRRLAERAARIQIERETYA